MILHSVHLALVLLPVANMYQLTKYILQFRILSVTVYAITSLVHTINKDYVLCLACSYLYSITIYHYTAQALPVCCYNGSF